MIRTVTLWVSGPVLRSIGHDTDYYYHNNDLSWIHSRYMHMWCVIVSRTYEVLEFQVLTAEAALRLPVLAPEFGSTHQGAGSQESPWMSQFR